MNSIAPDVRARLVVIRGAGDTATAVGRRLFLAGFPIVMTELAAPLCVRRTVAFSEAVFEGETVVEGVAARRAEVDELPAWPFEERIAVVVDEAARLVERLRPRVVVDARILKRPATCDRSPGGISGVLGPGARAGADCDFVVETRRGHDLGRVIYDGEASADTGEPAPVLGFSHQRVIYSSRDGVFEAAVGIADSVTAGDAVGWVDGHPFMAQIDGIVRGVLRSGVPVADRTKIADVDPRNCRRYCFTVSDRSNAIAGGVMEAVFALRQLWSD